jgi:hypothetical protein
LTKRQPGMHKVNRSPGGRGHEPRSRRCLLGALCVIRQSASAAGMPCPSDGNVCNGVEACDGVGACQHGTPLDCDDGNLCTQDSCDPLSGCANDATPATGCKTAEKSLLILKNNASDAKDKLIWKWIKGESTTQSEFGVPTGTTAYALCIYSGTTAAADYTVPGDAVKWRALGDTGYKYKDPTGSADGITKVLLKGSTHDTSKCLVKGKGANLDDPALEHLDDSNLVVVQLVNERTSACFESTFTTPRVSQSRRSRRVQGQVALTDLARRLPPPRHNHTKASHRQVAFVSLCLGGDRISTKFPATFQT